MRFLKYWRYPAEWPILRVDDRLLLILAGAIVGTSSGLAAVALNRSLVWMLDSLLAYRHFWWSFLLPAGGAALSALFLEKIVKEGAGHGVPEVIYSVSRRGGLLRFRSSYSRLISSALTIGSGGSAGPEAPVVMSGAAIGSSIARLFSLNERQRITLVGCGAAGAISSIFNAPIAGLVFTVEVVLGEWTALNIVPIAIASVAGTQISRILQGNQIAFAHHLFRVDLLDSAATVGLAAFTAAASILLTWALRRSHGVSTRLPAPLWLRAAIGGTVVGLIGYFFPVVIGEGYHWIQEMIEGAFVSGFGLALLLVFAKITATAFTLGWGGSGGIFGPCLVIGSLVGLTYHRLLEILWPSAGWIDGGCFALLGMAGLISGMLQAPLTGIFLISEITGGYGVILPLIIVSALSTTICQFLEPASFYLKELVERGQLLRPGTDGRVLADLSVSELIEKDCIAVQPNMLLGDLITIVQKSHRNYFPVEDAATGVFVGMVMLDDIRPYLFNPGMYHAVLLGQIMQTGIETVHPDDDLPEILERMDANHLYSMPVVANERFLGMISKATLLDRYRKELKVQTTLQ
ncbi:MAG: chloride channel protein [Desulfobacterales bacterium]|jgi:CIC family chloride channel protein|nr:chloride channel protein [Desulfobacterales bacterium]